MELLGWGYFAKTHGLKGELLLRAERRVKTKKLSAVFVEINGSNAPYFVSSARETDKGIIVSLEDVSNVNHAEKLVGKKVFADAATFYKEKAADDLTGFEVIDEQHGSLGIIMSTESAGGQMLAAVDHKGKELLLPMADALVRKIDRKKRVVHYAAPPGLIEMM